MKLQELLWRLRVDVLPADELRIKTRADKLVVDVVEVADAHVNSRDTQCL